VDSYDFAKFGRLAQRNDKAAKNNQFKNQGNTTATLTTTEEEATQTQATLTTTEGEGKNGKYESI